MISSNMHSHSMQFSAKGPTHRSPPLSALLLNCAGQLPPLSLIPRLLPLAIVSPSMRQRMELSRATFRGSPRRCRSLLRRCSSRAVSRRVPSSNRRHHLSSSRALVAGTASEGAVGSIRLAAPGEGRMTVGGKISVSIPCNGRKEGTTAQCAR